MKFQIVRKSCNSKSSSDLYTAEFEINDLRPAARSILTKGPTQDEISHLSGASISTRGRFISVAEKRSGNATPDRPLYLFVQASSKESVDLAVQRIEEITQMDRGPRGAPMVPTSSNVMLQMPQMTKPPPPVITSNNNTTNAMGTPSSTCIEKIFIGLDHAPLAFDLRSRLIGSGGANLNYIRTETGAMATLRGRGSLFIDPMMGMESPEPIHLYIEHLRYEGLQAAKQLARNLIETLQTELVQFQQVNPPMPSLQYSSQTTAVQQPQIYTHHTMAQPPPMLQPGGSIVTHALPPTYLQQPPPSTSQASQQHHHHQPVIQTHPMSMQLHPGAQGLVQIQQQTIAAGTTISLPPPAPPPHLSQPPPSLQQLQQQLPPPGQTQIVMNQAPPPNYQYQYIHTGADAQQTAAAAAPLNPGQVTIQHIYQAAPPPPQPMHSIMQPVNGSNTTYSDVTTTTFAQHLLRPPQQMQQQFITVQGNTAYMVPPPNMIQTTAQNPHQPPTSHTIIFSTQPPPQMLQQPPNYSMAQPLQAVTSREMSTMVQASSHQIIAVQQQQAAQGGPPGGVVHEEVKLEEKQGGELGDDFNEGQHGAVTLEGMVVQQQQQHQRAIMSAPPPIMSVPPPPTVQHIMGNSYVANPIFAQAPISASMQNVAQQQQTIHMLPPASSVAPGQQHPHQQQFVINPHGWPQHSMAAPTVVSTQQPPPMQHMGHNVHLGHHHPQQYRPGSGGTTYQQIQHPIMTAAAYNNSPLGGISVQYQSVPPPTSIPQQQQQQQPQPVRHLMQQQPISGHMENVTTQHHRGLITTTAVLQQPPPLPQPVLTSSAHQFKTMGNGGVPPPQQQQQQMMDGGGGQGGPVMTIKHQMPPPPYSGSSNNVMQAGGPPIQAPPPPPQPVPFPMQAQMENAAAAGQMMRTGQKRKIMEEDGEKGNLNGHGDGMSHRQQQQHHRRMVHEAFGQDAGQVPTSSYGGGGGGGGRTTSVGHGLSNSGISNTNSNDLTQDNYATTGHRSDDLQKQLHHGNAIMMPMANTDDPQQQSQIESQDEGNQYQAQAPHEHEMPQMADNGMMVPCSHANAAAAADPMGSANSHIAQMAMIRCNIMGKPPPPPPRLPFSSTAAAGRMSESAPLLANSQPPPRYSNQW